MDDGKIVHKEASKQARDRKYDRYDLRLLRRVTETEREIWTAMTSEEEPEKEPAKNASPKKEPPKVPEEPNGTRWVRLFWDAVRILLRLSDYLPNQFEFAKWIGNAAGLLGTRSHPGHLRAQIFRFRIFDKATLSSFLATEVAAEPSSYGPPQGVQKGGTKCERRGKGKDQAAGSLDRPGIRTAHQ